MRKQSGFTLVEIAIVLVIVGLLLGGVLKGQELIFNTRIKSTYSMSRELTAAVSGYQDRYRVLPGDDGAAATRFPAAPTLPTNGNSDGIVNWQTDPCAAGVQTGENCQAFYHLRLGGFLSGAGSESPKSPFGSNVQMAQQNAFISNASSAPGMALNPNGITHKIMNAIDTSFDDSNPATGSIRCQSLTSYNLSTPDNGIGSWCVLSM